MVHLLLEIHLCFLSLVIRKQKVAICRVKPRKKRCVRFSKRSLSKSIMKMTVKYSCQLFLKTQLLITNLLVSIAVIALLMNMINHKNQRNNLIYNCVKRLLVSFRKNLKVPRKSAQMLEKQKANVNHQVKKTTRLLCSRQILRLRES